MQQALASVSPSVTGTIHASTGAAAEGANVQLVAVVSDLKGVHSKVIGTAITDSAGHYSIPYPSANRVASPAKLDGGRVNWEVDASLGSAEAIYVRVLWFHTSTWVCPRKRCQPIFRRAKPCTIARTGQNCLRESLAEGHLQLSPSMDNGFNIK